MYAGLDLSRRRLDYCLLDADGGIVEVGTAPPDADGLRGLTDRLARHGEQVLAAIESMNGARFVHDRLELAGWQVEIADAQKVKGLAPLASRPTGSTPGCWPNSPAVTWCRQSGSRTRACVPSANGPAGACTSSATAPASSNACTRSCSLTASPARSAICSASAAGNCSRSSGCRSRGRARSRPACA